MGWREHILQEFRDRSTARLILAADPDGLLLEEEILNAIRDLGFELISYEEPVAFRYLYELRFRSRWDRGEETPRLVVRLADTDLSILPFDLLQIGCQLSFSLGKLFPNLSYPVVAALDRADLDALYEAQMENAPVSLGEAATQDFILRHVFAIAPELIKEPKDLLRILLRHHFYGKRLPYTLQQRLIQVLSQKERFRDWPLENIVSDSAAFLAFLQACWPTYLDTLASRQTDSEGLADVSYIAEATGAILLPFDDPEIRGYIEKLFLDGLLRPVPHPHVDALAETWSAYVIRFSKAENRRHRIAGLLQTIGSTLPASHARHNEWLHFAYRWAELLALIWEDGDVAQHRDRLKGLASQIDQGFTAWMQQRYPGLHNLPPIPPAMGHHIPMYLARQLEDHPEAKIALLVLDGLALDQWVVLREELKRQDAGLVFREDAVFAWVPTVTPVCRQAIFAAKAPVYFPTSIYSTAKEPELWRQFWAERGLAADQVAYEKGLGDSKTTRVDELIEAPKHRVLGLVIDKVDRMMHGMELGIQGLHNQVRQWVRANFLKELLASLHKNNFQVYLTSDHGNIEAVGIGNPKEGVIAEQRGQRARVYKDLVLLEQVHRQFPNAIVWPPHGLPEDYHVLLAPDRKAFVPSDTRLVTHGGICLEETVVPFIHIRRKEM